MCQSDTAKQWHDNMPWGKLRKATAISIHEIIFNSSNTKRLLYFSPETENQHLQKILCYVK